MKIAIIVGSHRHNSQSSKVGRVVAGKLAAMAECESVFTFDLAGNPLPLWDEGVWAGDASWQESFGPLSAELMSCDGLVIIAPEWSGMVPAGLKNFFLLCGKGELANKPGYIISVSAGDGGAYPVAELRSSSYKNTRICYIPEHLIVRKVEAVFNNDAADNDDRSQAYLNARMDFGLSVLCAYAAALATFRQSGRFDDGQYPFGM
jgi:NAD(P)H-dependent FMN reductase